MKSYETGNQSIGCSVVSCLHNASGRGCALSRIEVEPMSGCHTGEPCDESLCASYKAK